MYDGIQVEVVYGSHDAILEFLFGGDTDVAQDRAGKLGKKALNEVEPGAVFGREGEFEAADRSFGKPSLGLLGDVGGMIVEDQLDRCMGRIGGIEKFKEFDELAAAMAILDQGVDFASEQIDAGQQADRAVTLVFVIAREGRMGCRARAANPAPSRQSLGYRASRHRRRSPLHRLAFAWLLPRSP